MKQFVNQWDQRVRDIHTQKHKMKIIHTKKGNMYSSKRLWTKPRKNQSKHEKWESQPVRVRLSPTQKLYLSNEPLVYRKRTGCNSLMQSKRIKSHNHQAECQKKIQKKCVYETTEGAQASTAFSTLMLGDRHSKSVHLTATSVYTNGHNKRLLHPNQCWFPNK